jgi:hypothetical protein
MSDLTRRLEKLEEERDRVASPKRSRFPVLMFEHVDPRWKSKPCVVTTLNGTRLEMTQGENLELQEELGEKVFQMTPAELTTWREGRSKAQPG